MAPTASDHYRPESAPAPPFTTAAAAATKRPMFDRRRRRLNKTADNNNNTNVDKELGEMKKTASSSTRRFRRSSEPEFDDEELDPYDSDPGQSYRQHCMSLHGIGNKTCLGVPSLFKSQRAIEGGETVRTAPPSPLPSEIGDLFGGLPASLPKHMQRVRYSLRSSITDGAEKQPTGPSVMERRELRPNNVHLNVSHWSDMGARPYMEDR
jgi:hypothetical protein